MIKVYERTETNDEGTETMYLTITQGLAEVNRAMMGGRRYVKTMSSGRGNHSITYKDGRTVRLVEVLNPKLAAPKAEAAPAPVEPKDEEPKAAPVEQGPRTVTVKGKSYIVGEIIPARPRTPGAKFWIPVAYVRYWSNRNGKAFGATRTASADRKPGTVAHAVWHATLDAVNGTR